VNASIAGGSGIVPSLDVGGVEEENVFVLEDEEDDAEGEGELPETQSMPTTKLNDAQQSEEDIDNTPSVPPPPLEQRYEIKRGDTLRGISLKFGIDVRPRIPSTSLSLTALPTSSHITSAASTPSPLPQ
jgi:LysM repeat protein